MNAASNTALFDFHGVTSLVVEGNGKLMDYLCYQYNEFLQPINNRNADLRLKIMNKVSLSNKNNSYVEDQSAFYKANGDFYWKVYGKTVVLQGAESLSSISLIYCDAEFNRIQLNMIIELFLRIQFNTAGIALVHAACFSKNGNAILVPAAKSTGKTALCLNALKENFDFLSDDKVWLDRAGNVFSFPRYIVITESNAKYFQAWQGKTNSFRILLRRSLLSILPGSRSKYIMRKFLNRLVPYRAVYYKIKELYPLTKCPLRAKLLATVLLVRNKSNHLHAIEPDTIENFVAQVANLEWNYALLKIASLHDMLFIGGPKWHKELQSLIEDERRTVKEALQRKANYCLGLHGDTTMTNWSLIIKQLRNLIPDKNPRKEGVNNSV